MVQTTSLRQATWLLCAIAQISFWNNGVYGDFACLCNYNVDEQVFEEPSMDTQSLGSLYEYDCKPLYGTSDAETSEFEFVAIQFHKRVGYVVQKPNVVIQICLGEPGVLDTVVEPTDMPLNASKTTQSAASTAYKMTTPTSTTIRTTTPSTTTVRLTTPSTTTQKPTTPTTTTPKPTTPTTTTLKPTTPTTTTLKPTTPTTTTPKPTTPTTTTPKPTTPTTTTPKPTTPTTTTPRPTTPTTTTPKPTTTTTTTPKPTTPTTTTPKPTTPTTTTPKPTTTTPKPTTTTPKPTTTTPKPTTTTPKPTTTTPKPTTTTPKPTTTTPKPTTTSTTTPRPTTQPPCDDGWELNGESCYYFQTDSTSPWGRARNSCRQQGADLVVIESRAESRFLTAELESIFPYSGYYAYDYVWTAGTDKFTEGRWEWDIGILEHSGSSHMGHHGMASSSTAMPSTTTQAIFVNFNQAYTNWGVGSPSAYYSGQDCLCLNADDGYKWDDCLCSEWLYYICEKARRIPAVVPPPKVPTTTVATHTLECPSGWLSHGASCYLFSSGRMNWDDASSYCVGHSGQLVEIQDSDENLFLQEQLLARIDITSGMGSDDYISETGVWTSGSDIGAEGLWEWTHLLLRRYEPITYKNWYPGQPGDAVASDDCLAMVGGNLFRWLAHDCTDELYFVCEQELSLRDEAVMVG